MLTGPLPGGSVLDAIYMDVPHGRGHILVSGDLLHLGQGQRCIHPIAISEIRQARVPKAMEVNLPHACLGTVLREPVDGPVVRPEQKL